MTKPEPAMKDVRLPEFVLEQAPVAAGGKYTIRCDDEYGFVIAAHLDRTEAVLIALAPDMARLIQEAIDVEPCPWCGGGGSDEFEPWHSEDCKAKELLDSLGSEG